MGKLSFTGSSTADLFTRQIAESFQGVLDRNMKSNPDDPMLGFISASIDGRPWTDTMWTRDAGTFLRELVQWGELERAVSVSRRLISLVRSNPEGYFTFPMYFELGQPGTGSELDGTAAIIIGLVLLWERLEPSHPARREIEAFLEDKASPLAFILHRLAGQPLISGSGEFGGGCGIEGEYINSVQNNLVRLSLVAARRMAAARGDVMISGVYRAAAEKISTNMLEYLRDEGGSWVWAASAETLRPDPRVNEHVINKGFGGLNGILSMTADVSGFTLLDSHWEGIEACQITFEKLYSFPLRRALFEKYGAWSQFDEHIYGYLIGPSYGHGYATQAMLLMDRLEMAGQAVDFLANVTCHPLPANHLDRDADTFFYERIYLPELLEILGGKKDTRFNIFDGEKFDQGCGALNLVCVAEPLKIARLIAGVDDLNPGEVKIVPRLLPSWSGYIAEGWPVLTEAGLSHVNISCDRDKDGLHLSLSVVDGAALPRLAVRIPAAGGWAWIRSKDVSVWKTTG